MKPFDLSEYKNLGDSNGWKEELPPAYIKCKKKGHYHHYKKLNKSGTYREYFCLMCKIKYTADEGD